MLEEILDMPRGEPQILVTFKLDKKCRVTANALEKSSGGAGLLGKVVQRLQA